MTTPADVALLVKEANALMKRELRAAIGKLEAAFAMARAQDNAAAASEIAAELARAWGRRRSGARALYYASKATELTPQGKGAWATLAKTCELMAVLTTSEPKRKRAQALYRQAAKAFKQAAALTKDPEDRRWLQELASGAQKSAGPA